MGKKHRQERAAAMENQAKQEEVSQENQIADENYLTSEEGQDGSGGKEVALDNKSQADGAGEEAAPAAAGEVVEEDTEEEAGNEGQQGDPEEVEEVKPAIEPTQSTEPTPAPVVQASVTEEKAKEPTPASASQVGEDGVSENVRYLEGVRQSGTPLQKQALDAIELFVSRMKPRAPISEEKALEAQRDFLDLITVILRKDYEDFRKAWAVLLVYFAEYHGDRPTAKDYSALSEYSTSRCLDAWNDNERSEAYNNFMTLLRVTRNIETRKQDVKRIRLDAIAPTLLSDRAKDNLQRFYA